MTSERVMRRKPVASSSCGVMFQSAAHTVGMPVCKDSLAISRNLPMLSPEYPIEQVK